MVKARQILECMVRCLAEKACLVDGDLADTIDQLYEGHWIDKTTKDDYHTIRILGNKAVHENDNTAYNANQAYQLLTKQVYAFSHDFQVSKTFNVPVTETRPVRNTRTGAAAGSSGTGSTSYGRTDGTRPRTGTGAGNGTRSGAELQGVSGRSRTGGSRNRAGSNTNIRQPKEKSPKYQALLWRFFPKWKDPQKKTQTITCRNGIKIPDPGSLWS